MVLLCINYIQTKLMNQHTWTLLNLAAAPITTFSLSCHKESCLSAKHHLWNHIVNLLLSCLLLAAPLKTPFCSHLQISLQLLGHCSHSFEPKIYQTIIIIIERKINYTSTWFQQWNLLQRWLGTKILLTWNNCNIEWCLHLLIR